jgi:hypothetical protein
MPVMTEELARQPMEAAQRADERWRRDPGREEPTGGPTDDPNST